MELEPNVKPYVETPPISTKPLYEALAAAQGELKPIAKRSTNPFYKSKYAPLEDVCEYLFPILSKNGLSVYQATRISGEWIVLKTTLAHKSGASISSDWPVAKIGAKQQELGSAMTYSRRYSVLGICGATSIDEDDDGQMASQKPAAIPQKKEKKEVKPKSEVPVPTNRKDKEAWLRNYCSIKKLGLSLSKKMDEYNADSFTKLSDEDLSELVEWAKEQ